MAFIYCGEWKYYHFFFLVFAIGYYFKHNSENNLIKINGESPQFLFQELIYYLGESLVIILFIIQKKNSESPKKPIITRLVSSDESEEKFHDCIEEINKSKMKKIKINKFFLYLYLFFNVAINFVIYILYQKVIGDSMGKKYKALNFILEFIFTIILSRFLLHINLYRHHFLALFLMFIGVILYFLSQIIKMEHKNVGTYILIIIRCLILSLFKVVNNFLMIKHIGNCFNMTGFIGLFGIFVVIICIIIGKAKPNIGSGFQNYFVFDFIDQIKFAFTYRFKITIGFILYFLSVPVYELFGFLINYRYTPTHLLISDLFNISFYDIIPFDVQKYKEIEVQKIFAYIFFVLGTLIYNEIIVLGVFDLDKYTEKGIRERGESEHLCYLDLSKGSIGLDDEENGEFDTKNPKIEIQSVVK